MTQSYAENQTIAAYFEDQNGAERAVQELYAAGFSSAHLGVAHRGTYAGTGETSTGTSHTHKHTGEGVWDKVKNFFEGGVEPYAEERSRGDMATREITTTSGDTTSSYGTSQGYGQGYGQDDLHQTLTGMSVPEERSRYFGRRFAGSQNGAVVTVNAGERAAEAERILRDNGGDLGDTSTQYAGTETADYPGTPISQNTGSYQDNATYTGNEQNAQPVAGNEGLQNIQLLGEVLRVHKERIDRGEVRIRKEVITENQTVQVPVTREELVIERRAVSGDTQAQGRVGEGQEIRIPLTEETASIDKGTVVREEVAVGKKPVSEVRDLSGEVSREELVVDDQSRRAVNE